MMEKSEGSGRISIFTEIEEFAGFSLESQRYIRRSLDIASRAPKAIERWSINSEQRGAVRAQADNYHWLERMRTMLGQAMFGASKTAFLTLLVELSAFDLDSGELDGFAQYRFLYERLLGSRARPWLPSAFSAVVLMPHVKPNRRIALLSTLGEAAVAPWSEKEPTFHPEQIAA